MATVRAPLTMRNRPMTATAPLDVGVIEGCRAALLELKPVPGSRIGVTSAVAGEGRTTMALGLAHVLREDYRMSVLMLDLDLENPGLTRYLGAAPWPGVTELLRGEATVEDVIQEIAPKVFAITPGSGGSAAPRLMLEAQKIHLVERLQAEADVIVADLPALLTCGYGRGAAADFPDLLLVIRGGVTPLARIREAVELLPTEPKVLLNGARSAMPRWLLRLLDV